MKIEKAKISALKLNPANPRTIKDDKFAQLVRSVRDFPQMLEIRPIVVNAKMEVLGGNMRLRACIEAGLTEVPIIRAENLTDDQQREFIIKDNVGFGEWDWEALSNEWDAEELADWGLDVPDFATGGGYAQEDDYEVPDEIQTDIVAGDLFEIGQHRLLCGDSTKAEDVARLMGGHRADMVFTDPDFSMPLDTLLTCYENTKLHSTGFGFWICGDKQAVFLASSDFENFAHFYVHDFRIPNLISNSRSMQRHTLIAKFGSKGINNLHDGFSTIIGVATDRKGREIAPMAKKVELPFAFIQHYSGCGEIILDVFAHSGSTAVAAEQLDRVCYMLEIEPKYCQCIVNRLVADNPGIKITKNGKEYLHNPLDANNLQPLIN